MFRRLSAFIAAGDDEKAFAKELNKLNAKQLTELFATTDKDGFNLLFMAVTDSRHEIIRLLLTVDNNYANKVPQHGMSPLMLACRYGSAEIIHILYPYTNVEFLVKAFEEYIKFFRRDQGKGKKYVENKQQYHSTLRLFTGTYHYLILIIF